MTLETWLVFTLAYFLITLSPGPNVLLVCTHAMKYGPKSVATTISANLLCQLLIVIAVAFGIGALVTAGSSAFMIIKYCGAAYLIYLGVKTIYATLRTNSRTSASTDLGSKVRNIPSRRKRFIEAFFVSAGNPKTVIFLAAFLPQFVNADAAIPLQFAQMFMTIALLVTSVHIVFAYLALLAKGRVTSQRTRRNTSLMTGGLFVFLGFQLSRA